ncbi:MAG TPA: hypothetical protein VFS39_17170 [Nitrospira sp.]|nr:hypothetical protein [Nitrospira sp.]
MSKHPRISPGTKSAIDEIFQLLPYRVLGSVYCYEGGREFWRRKREPCRRLGLRIAGALIRRLRPHGRSLYVGAGVAELPALLAETLELGRLVCPYNLRRVEVASLNRACGESPVRFRACDAGTAPGRYDHLWMVSVLNDPERFPELSRLSYGRADPATFNLVRFRRERQVVQDLVARCLGKLSVPGLVTTSTEEVVWIAQWCHRKQIPYLVERRQYPTALVGDPLCFIRIGGNTRRRATIVPQVVR